MYAFALVYLIVWPVIEPLFSYIKTSCSAHHHYDSQVIRRWQDLYSSFERLAATSPITTASIPTLLYETLRDLLCLCLPARTNATEKQSAEIGAWIRMCEIQCLGGKLFFPLSCYYLYI